MSLDDLNKIILKNSKKQKDYINPHMIYKVLEEKEKNGFSDEEFDIDNKQNNPLDKTDRVQKKHNKLGQTFNILNNQKKNKKNEVNKYDFSQKERNKMPFDLLKELNAKGKFSEEESTNVPQN